MEDLPDLVGPGGDRSLQLRDLIGRVANHVFATTVVYGLNWLYQPVLALCVARVLWRHIYGLLAIERVWRLSQRLESSLMLVLRYRRYLRTGRDRIEPLLHAVEALVQKTEPLPEHGSTLLDHLLGRSIGIQLKPTCELLPVKVRRWGWGVRSPVNGLLLSLCSVVSLSLSLGLSLECSVLLRLQLSLQLSLLLSLLLSRLNIRL
jgi:hypothetical protein